MKFGVLLPGITLLLSLAFLESPAQKKHLGYEQVFEGAAPRITRPLPVIVQWLDDDHYLEVKNSSTPQQMLLKVEAKSGKSEQVHSGLIPAFQDPEVLLKNDDIFYEQGSSAGQQLTKTPEAEKNPALSPDNKWVAFTRKNDLYALEIATGKETRLTHDGSDVIYNGYASWVYFEEILGRASQYKAFWWSPDSKRICFMRFDDSQVPVFPIYHAEGQHGFLENQHYPKAGDPNPAVRIGIVSLQDSATVWSDFNEKDDQYFGTPNWTPEGSLWVQWMPRSQDQLKIYAIDLKNGRKKEIYTEQQKTWISLDDLERIHFVPGGKEFILSSDKTGWMQLYLHDMTGREIRPLTQGSFTVTGIEYVDAKSRQVYFTAKKESSARFDFYRVGLDGKGFTRLSFGEYSHAVNPSPTMKYFISTYSNLSTPAKMTLCDAAGKPLRELGSSLTPEAAEYFLPETELVRVKSGDGLFDLPMLITYPANFDKNKKYPVLVTIYGGPDAGKVFDTWQNVSGPMNWWAKEGIIQVVMDNRSSGHFGKAGMNYIYRQLGKFEIEDYSDCARWLKMKPFVDSSKICITGGSFGGYLTCMALTYGAGEFTHGIANFAVTDWKLYDTHYTERFMDKPQENPEGYVFTSVFTHLDKYRGLLRIVHGSTDDNVHTQNSIQLISRLQELKKHFEFMLYPGERHGIQGKKGLHQRLESYKFYYTHLLGKPMPEFFWK